MGFPIRKSTDQSLFAAPHGLSQRITSFIACVCQGIHQMPLFHLIIPIAHDHRVKARSRRTLTECPSALSANWQSQFDDLAVYKAHVLRRGSCRSSVVLLKWRIRTSTREASCTMSTRTPQSSSRRADLVKSARSFHSSIANMKDVQSVHVLQRCSSCQSRRCRQN